LTFLAINLTSALNVLSDRLSLTDVFRNALGPMIALAGTVLITFLGYRQWRKQQDWVRYGGLFSERQTAYKALWQKLEAVHLYVRSAAFDQNRFDELVRSANVHLIESGLLLDRGEKKRANDYMSALRKLGELLAADSAATQSGLEARKTLYDTQELPAEVLTSVEGLRQAYLSVEEQRNQLITHFRQILGADFFS
jgi:hypothetical protein